MITHGLRRKTDRVDRVKKPALKRSFAEKEKLGERLHNLKLRESLHEQSFPKRKVRAPHVIVTFSVGGMEPRVFGVHEDMLRKSPLLKAMTSKAVSDGPYSKRVRLPDEDPESFSYVLEFLYKNDYNPRIHYDEGLCRWKFESTTGLTTLHPKMSVLHHQITGEVLLREAVLYCAADRYGLEDLKEMSVFKLTHLPILDPEVMVRSALYVWRHTPDPEPGRRPNALRCLLLDRMIKQRVQLMRSGLLQQEMELGGKIWYDLFAAACGYMDGGSNGRHGGSTTSVNSSPRTI